MRAAILLGSLCVGLLLALPNAGRAEDVTTLSGVTYERVRLTRVEPDGLTYVHALGIAKLAFTDLPEPLRRAYSYDPQRAAAYAKDSAERAAAKRARDRQLVEAAEATRVTAASARAANATTAAASNASASSATGAGAPNTAAQQPAATFTYGGDRFMERWMEEAVSAVSGQMETARQRAAAKNKALTLWESKYWRFVPIGFIDGRAREDFNVPSYLRRENAELDLIGPREVPAGR